MKTTIRTFQREFPRMRKLAAAGKTVIIEAEGQTYEFSAKTKSEGILGCMAGSVECDNLDPNRPAIPLEEWGDLAK